MSPRARRSRAGPGKPARRGMSHTMIPWAHSQHAGLPGHAGHFVAGRGPGGATEPLAQAGAPFVSVAPFLRGSTVPSAYSVSLCQRQLKPRCPTSTCSVCVSRPWRQGFRLSTSARHLTASKAGLCLVRIDRRCGFTRFCHERRRPGQRGITDGYRGGRREDGVNGQTWRNGATEDERRRHPARDARSSARA
jgi:hypothetical protein